MAGTVCDRINDFYSNKSEIYNKITEEKEIDPSREILEVDEEIKNCDPFIEFLISANNSSLRK